MVIEINNDNFEREIIKSEIPVIIDFYADWCGPCQMMKPVFEELSQKFKGKLKFVKINTGVNPEITQRYEITGIPCLIVINKGKEIDRIIGFKNSNELQKNIQDILAKIK
ncbi:MAG: thioredoxin [Candidatus Pacearchaeota archaeon]